MINPQELREIADFTDVCVKLFEAILASKHLEILFDEQVVGAYTITRRDGTLLGTVKIVDSGCYEFVPEIESE